MVVPLLFTYMTDVLEKVKELLEPLLDGTDVFLVDIKLKPINNIKIYLDADGGLSIDKSASVNKKLYALIEAANWFPDGDYSLEVSSPGIDEPLLQMRQYKKNIGRKVAVTTIEEKEVMGILKTVDEEKIVLEQKLPKKTEVINIEIPFSQIKKTVVQIIFN